MKYTRIAYVEKPVSRIILGTASQPFILGGDGAAILDGAVENGINTFDLARNYGYSERSVGTWLKERGCRKQVVLISKCGHPDEKGNSRINEGAIRADLEKSCEELGTEYIDVYLLHRDDTRIPVSEIAEIMNKLHGEGRIGAFGGSNWTYRRIAEINAYAVAHGLIPFSVSSPNFGLARQVNDPWGGGCVSISGPENEDARKWYRQHKMPVIAYSSLGRGLFSGKIKSSEQVRATEILDPVAVKGYVSEDNFERLRRAELLAKKYGVSVPQITLCWLFRRGLDCCAVVSSTKAENFAANVAALDVPLTEQDADYLDLKENV